MAIQSMDRISEQIREVTDDEVTHYRENGWVELKQLVSPELTGELLAHVKDVTGLPYDELPEGPDAEAVVARIKEAGRGIFQMLRLEDDLIYEIMASPKLGTAASRLTGFARMRLFTDGAICKMPSWAEELGGLIGGETAWHQDMPPMPVDRPYGVQFWLAMCEITPEMGSMVHLSGSHHEPPIGNIQYSDGQTLESERPDILERYEVSPAHHFQPGDVLAHNALTLHSAQRNSTDRLRWVYTSYRIPANSLYNGVPNERFKEFNFQPWKPHDHPKFPVVSE